MPNNFGKCITHWGTYSALLHPLLHFRGRRRGREVREKGGRGKRGGKGGGKGKNGKEEILQKFAPCMNYFFYHLLTFSHILLVDCLPQTAIGIDKM